MNQLSISDLKSLSKSSRYQDRLRALKFMRKNVYEGVPKSYLKIAASMISDRSESCRWQSAIVVSEYLDYSEELVWSIVDRFIKEGTNRGVDSVSTVLVEHLLERNFDKYFRRLKSHWLSGNSLIVEILTYCWAFGDAEAHWGEVEEFLESARSRSS
ncbi:hypothetical protein V202x_21040 [Gimesia aquarii]|uniref:Uncharacterized protein n=1 Tax=Gimesia aquarii TaxID=2527964 RepID=A0A517WU09_9PLAN|nr:hypothetical protein V202x_21040 [Gimesia aquarii]